MIGDVALTSDQDLVALMRGAVHALSALEEERLVALLAEAQVVRQRRCRIDDAVEALELRHTLGELLAATARSLRTLQRLRGAVEDAWVR